MALTCEIFIITYLKLTVNQNYCDYHFWFVHYNIFETNSKSKREVAPLIIPLIITYLKLTVNQNSGPIGTSKTNYNIFETNSKSKLKLF